MSTKATHTKHSGHGRYVPGTSRRRHSATTLLAQVADKQRGERIKDRREELHLTQPAVVELLEAAAWRLPEAHELHPVTAGKNANPPRPEKPPVTLRGYQSYEGGGGIVWEKAKLLAGVLQMDVQALMSGEPEPTNTPDLSRAAGGDALADRFDQLQRQVTDQLTKHAEAVEGLLKRQDEVLDRIEKAIAASEAAREQLRQEGQAWAERAVALGLQEFARAPETQEVVPGTPGASE